MKSRVYNLSTGYSLYRDFFICFNPPIPQIFKKPSNELKVKLNLANKARKNRVYPELEKGDEVKIFKQRKPNEKKG